MNQYAFEIESTGDLNRLIERLASIQSDVRQIRLSHLKEPNGLGWMTRVPEGNKIPVIFSIGDQTTIDEWYKTVRKPFGQMEFTATPVAVPPTLTIFVQNDSVKLDELTIPEGIDVSSGYVPSIRLSKKNRRRKLPCQEPVRQSRSWIPRQKQPKPRLRHLLKNTKP